MASQLAFFLPCTRQGMVFAFAVDVVVIVVVRVKNEHL